MKTPLDWKRETGHSRSTRTQHAVPDSNTEFQRRPSIDESKRIGLGHVDPELTVVGKGRRTRFSSDVPVIVLEPRARGRQENGVGDGDIVRVLQRGGVMAFRDAEVVLADFEDPGFDLGQFLRMPCELGDEIRL